MRQLKFKKQTTQGLVDGVLRVHEKYIYLKYNDTTQTKQVIAEFKKKGISIEEGKGWLKIDLLGDNKTIKRTRERHKKRKIWKDCISRKVF